MKIRDCISFILASGKKQPSQQKLVEADDFFLIQSFDKNFARFVSKFLLAVIKRIGGEGELRKLPFNLERWSVLSSPFAHKTAWSQFERREYVYKVSMRGISEHVANMIFKYTSYLLPPGIRITSPSK
jgi:ribosomal protein S10